MTLSATIDSELEWREKELALLKKQLLQEQLADDEIRFRLAYRSFVALTYAHYEGFVKVLASETLSAFRQAAVPPAEYTDSIQIEFFAAAIRKRIEQISNKELIPALVSGTKLINSLPLPSDDGIWAIGNLDVATFSKLIASIGLNTNDFLDYRRSIGRLVSLRHECAHGEFLQFDSSKTLKDLADELFGIQSHITLLLHDISLKTLDHVDRREFALNRYLWAAQYIP